MYSARVCGLLTLLLTLCGIIGQDTHRGGVLLSGLVREEAHPCFSYSTQPSTKSIDTGSINLVLIIVLIRCIFCFIGAM